MDLKELFSLSDAAIEKMAARGFVVSENGNVSPKGQKLTLGEKVAAVLREESPQIDRVVREYGAAFARQLCSGPRFAPGLLGLGYLGDDPQAVARSLDNMTNEQALSWLAGKLEVDEEE